MKLNIPIEVVFNDLNSMIDELGKLQKYKLGEGDDMTLVDVCDVADILMRHVKAREAKRGTHWIPCSERLPEQDEDVLVCTEDGRIEKAYHTLKEWCEDEWEWFVFGTLGYSYALNDYEVIAWMPLPKPYGGDAK